jgi:hypothetical protein
MADVTPTTGPAKETRAQRAERLKREKNPWQCLSEIRGFAREGYDSIPADWLDSCFPWWDACPQGAVGKFAAVERLRRDLQARRRPAAPNPPEEIL